MSSEISSLAPSKPPEYSSEDWNELTEIIMGANNENYVPCQEIVLEITDIDENGEVSIAVEKSNLINCEVVDLDYIEEENINNVERVADKQRITEKSGTRKRQRDPSSWKQNVRKCNRQQGAEYLDSKGKLKPSRKVKKETCHTKKCPFKCIQVISDDERNHIHKQFWKLTDDGKVHFYSKHIKRIVPLRKRTNEEISKKKYSYEYHFEVSGVKCRVCQEYFLNTLDISKNRVYYFFKKNKNNDVPNLPTQGKHKKKYIKPEKKDEVRAHINSLPSVESHYCRAQTKKKYLERGLSLRKIYDLYKSFTEDPVKFNVYSGIFNNEYNIAFFKPKKDLCDKCELFKVTVEPTQDQTAKYDEHMKRKNVGNQERNRDRIRFLENNEVGVVTFDLQNTFSLPKANVSSFYYKTKLCCYNLTAHLDKTKVVYNAIWHEFIAGRAAIHIASGMFRILKEVMRDNPQLKRLILWSDSCVPQNKNSIMSFAIQYFLRSEYSKDLESIEQKFSEPGHGNVQEIDNAHSCIERHIKDLEIWSPLSLVRQLLLISPTWKLKFKVLQMKQDDYLNFQLNAKTLNYKTIPYTRVKHIVYSKKDVNILEYKENFEGAVTEKTKIQLIQAAVNKKVTRGTHKRKCAPYDFSTGVPLADLEINISDLKRKHLLEMKPFIPNDSEKVFYDTLLGIKNTPKKIIKKKNVLKEKNNSL